MKQLKQTIKRMVDLAMIVLLPLLMAEKLIGQEIHEWLGTVMMGLFIAHHMLNLGWWKGLLKGKYTPSRAFGTALDLLLLLDMAALCVSGIMMSGFVFRFLHISGGMMIARQLHLFAQHMTDHLFLQTHFVLFDETKAAVVYFAEIVAMMCLFAAVAYYINKLLRKAGADKEFLRE